MDVENELGGLGRLTSFDWHSTSVGPRSSWPTTMRAVVDTILASDFPICSIWGDEGLQIYNEAYGPIFGTKHPAAFGRPVRESWPEIWDFLGPAIEQVRRSRQALWFKDTLLPLALDEGRIEECYFDFSYSPVIDDLGDVLGVMSVAADKTRDVIFRRRQKISDIVIPATCARPVEALAEATQAVLAENAMDVALGAFYRVRQERGHCRSTLLWALRDPHGEATTLIPQVDLALDAGSLGIVTRNDPRDAQCNTAFVAPLHDRSGRVVAALLIAGHALVPLQQSLRSFCEALGGRLHDVLHAAEEGRREIVEREELYRFLFDNMKDGAVYAALDADGGETIIAANDAATALLGYSVSEMEGATPTMFAVPGDAGLATGVARRQRDGYFVGETSLRHKDGSIISVEISSRLVPWDDGGMRSLTVLRDIAHRAAEQRQQAERVRLETIATLSSGIAHDFNNLLTAIIGSVEALAEAAMPGSASDTLAATALAAARRGSELTAQLLDHARRGAGQPVATDLNTAVREAEPLIKAVLDERFQFATCLVGDELPIEVDPSRLLTAILNLAINARDAMPVGGQITLTTSRSRCTTNCVELTITDHGEGIDPAFHARIFEPFFTTKPVGSGSGLGLAMVAALMRQARGEVSLVSAPGEGTSITLRFPTAGNRAETPARAFAERLILYVEDDDLVRVSTIRMLHRIGMTPIAAASGDEGLRLLAENPDIDLVLTDLVMPGMSGLDLARLLRRDYPHIHVVLTTGNDPGDLLASPDARSLVVVRKPYTTAGLKEALNVPLASN